MKPSFTEEQLRQVLHGVAATGDIPPKFGRKPRATAVATSAIVIAAAAVAVPVIVTGNQQPSSHIAQPTYASGASPTSASSGSPTPTPTPAQAMWSIADLAQVGMKVRSPTSTTPPLVDERSAIGRAHGVASMGLYEVGFDHYADPDSPGTSSIVTEWRLVWVVLGQVREGVRVPITKENGSPLREATTQSLHIVDAGTGEVLRSFTQ